MNRITAARLPTDQRAVKRRRVIGRLMREARGVRLRVLVQLWLLEVRR